MPRYVLEEWLTLNIQRAEFRREHAGVHEAAWNPACDLRSKVAQRRVRDPEVSNALIWCAHSLKPASRIPLIRNGPHPESTAARSSFSNLLDIFVLLLSCPTFGYIFDCERPPTEHENLEKKNNVFSTGFAHAPISNYVIFISYFHSTWLHPCFQNQPKSHPKPTQEPYRIRSHFRYRYLLSFKDHLAIILRSKSKQTSIQFCDSFCTVSKRFCHSKKSWSAAPALKPTTPIKACNALKT